MRNIIQKSLVIALLYYTTILIGCIKDQCNCAVPKTGKFRYTQITVSNLTYNFSADNTFSVTTNSQDTITKNQYGIRFQFDYKTALLQHKKIQYQGFINSAYACSCMEDNYTSADTVKKIFIKTLFDFDATHLAGSDVTSYFNTVYQNYSPSSIQYGDAFIANYIDFNQQYKSEGSKEYDLYLKKTAMKSQDVAFELFIEYTNGTSISAKTKPVFLK